MNNKIKKIINKKNKSKIVCLTAYSKNIAEIVDNHADIVLVGDSMANVLYGHKNTHEITLENIIQHTLSVKMGVKKSLLVVDMPKGTYGNTKIALRNAKLIMKKTKCDAVKLESNKKNYKIIENLVDKKIPVMGHIGLKPQSVLVDSGYKIHGKTLSGALKIFHDALALEKAGVFALVLEGIPEELGQLITQTIKIPTVGIGAGKFCDGQIRVTADLLGLNDKQPPFCKPIFDGKKYFEEKLKEWVASERLS